MDRARLLFAAARARAVDFTPRSGPAGLPYLASAIFSMVPVPTFMVPTMGVDDNWRVYWNPARVMEWGVEATAAVLLHEAGHLLREHGSRFRTMNDPKCLRQAWNWAGDAAINHDLRDGGWDLPGDPWFPETVPSGQAGMLTEEFYRLLRQAAQEASDTSDSTDEGEPDDGESGDDQSDTSDSTSGDDAGEGISGQDGGDPGEDSADGQPGSATDGQPQDESGMTPCRIHGQNCPAANTQDPGCGSGADGQPRPWELPPDDPTATSVSEARARLIRQQVAVAIREHVKGRGSVPGGWDRWAESILEPKVDPVREMRVWTSRHLARVAGKDDYSYARPSRRSFGHSVILPSTRQFEPPRICLITDTSGSMSDRMLGLAAGLMAKLIRTYGAAAGGEGLQVLYCDAAPTDPVLLKQVRDVRFVGGGGTDMRVGMEAAAQMPKRPHIAIVVTDGYTPWPAEPPDPQIAWGALIVAESVRDRDAVAGVPTWMKTIPVEIATIPALRR